MQVGGRGAAKALFARLTWRRSDVARCCCRLVGLLGILVAASLPMQARSQETATYTYDALARLSSTAIAGGANNGTKVGACFDAAGNRLTYSIGPTTISCSAAAPPNSSWSSTLDSGLFEPCNDFGCSDFYGYRPEQLTGSMSNTNFNGNIITGLFSYSGTPYSVILYMSGPGGATPANSGWTTITIPGVGTLNRASAIYTPVSGSATWQWVNIGNNVSSGAVTIQ